MAGGIGDGAERRSPETEVVVVGLSVGIEERIGVGNEAIIWPRSFKKDWVQGGVLRRD